MDESARLGYLPHQWCPVADKSYPHQIIKCNTMIVYIFFNVMQFKMILLYISEAPHNNAVVVSDAVQENRLGLVAHEGQQWL